jgi:uncharacterized protein YjbJ (UPF0337 family)
MSLTKQHSLSPAPRLNYSPARALNKLRPAGGTAATSLQIFYDLNDMDSSSSNKIKGSLHEAKGKIKQDTGKVTGNRDLEERGAAEKTGGKVEKKVGDIKKVFGK